MFTPEVQRCMAEIQSISMKLVQVQKDPSISVSKILQWEREGLANLTEMNRLSVQHGFPDRELGNVAGEATLRMSVLLGLLMRANEGTISPADLLERIRNLKSLYSTCERLSSGANHVNQQFLVVDYPERLAELDMLEKNVDKFIFGNSGSVTHSPPKSNAGCYIATAVYGEYDHPSVLVLRRFRDEQLRPSALGRFFIRTYYAISPSLSRYFSSVPWLKKASRRALDSLVDTLSR
jgi:hypothetical protein